MPRTPITPLRLTPEDLEVLGEVLRRTGAASLADGVRIAIRHYVATTPKARTTKREPLGFHKPGKGETSDEIAAKFADAIIEHANQDRAKKGLPPIPPRTKRTKRTK